MHRISVAGRRPGTAVLALILLASAAPVFIFGINSSQPVINDSGTPVSGQRSGGLPLSLSGGQTQAGGSGVQNPGQLDQGMGSGSAASAATGSPSQVQSQPAPVYPPCNYCSPGAGHMCPMSASYPCSVCGGYPSGSEIACIAE